MGPASPLDGLNAVRRQVRLIVLIDSAEKAGLAPLSVRRLHTFAFLSNILAPVWEMPVLDGKVLKRRGGPFYTTLQRELDSLVGMGVAIISNLGHTLDEQNRWRLEGSYRLHRLYANRILERIAGFDEERRFSGFLEELALALSALSDEDLDKVTTEDATYSDPIVDFGNVLDFAEWQNKNSAAAAATQFGKFLPGRVRPDPGEKLHLYLRHLRARIHGGR
jgi:hypothetical protein